jgi:hypothetical protein
MVGAHRLPDVRGAVPQQSGVRGTWISSVEHVLENKLEPSRPLFRLQERAVDREKEIGGSLNHRTVSARVCFLHVSHVYDVKGKRKCDGEPVMREVQVSGKHVRRAFNTTGRVLTIDFSHNTLRRRYADGSGTSASFQYPAGVALDGAGNMYVADFARAGHLFLACWAPSTTPCTTRLFGATMGSI